MTRILIGLAGLACALPASAADTVTYTYDVFGRVVSASHTGSVNPGVQTSYNYDPADNRISNATTGASH
jgi:YD repeat-containing protein